jgi:glucose/arabinose dehydrogenase
MNRLTVAGLLASLAFSACANSPSYTVETVAEGLDHPWSLAFLPDGRKLVTERAGRLRLIEDGRLRPEPVANVPPAYVAGQGGLMEVLLAPDFAESGTLFLSLAHGDRNANHTRVVRARLVGERLEDVTPIFTSQPARSTAVHYGGRMDWLPDGTLVLGLGDAFNLRHDSQKIENHVGTIVRIRPDGSVPPDNPFVNTPGAKPDIYSYGHRNVQGIVWDTRRNALFAHEHGPKGGDEFNRIEPGKNYGWPIATHGVEYSGAQITPHTELPGVEPPLTHWSPSIAPAGLAHYTAEAFPEWTDSFFIAALANRAVWRLRLDAQGRVATQERLFDELGERIRDVRQGPDGFLYLLTDSPRGKVLRIRPA